MHEQLMKDVETIELLLNHRSVRNFTQKEIPKSDLKKIVLSAQAASTSSHGQAYSIIDITDSKIKRTLSEYAGNQQQVIDSAHFFVFCADLHRLEKIAQKSNVEMQDSLNSVEMFLIATIDAVLAAQNAAIAAESLGLGIVYTGGIRNNPEKVSSLLNLPHRVYPVFGMCLGYPDLNEIPSQKPRLPIEAIFFENQYQPFDETYKYIEKYDEIMKDYYLKRSGGERKDTWSDVLTDKRKIPRRLFMKSFLEGKGFPLD